MLKVSCEAFEARVRHETFAYPSSSVRHASSAVNGLVQCGHTRHCTNPLEIWNRCSADERR